MNGFVAEGVRGTAGLVARTIHERKPVPGSTFRARALTAAAIAAGCACAILTPAAMGETTDLAPNWQVSSSASVTDTGGGLSQAGFDTAAWLKVKTNDANAVGSEVAAEIQNTPADAQCGDNNIFYGENITTCQGAQPGAHDAPLAASRYAVPWWFRTEFTPDLKPGQNAELQIRGIMGKADLWVNGTQVSTQAVLQGSEPEYDFDITSLIKPGANAIALKLYANNPGAMLNQDFNDWTQAARDQNTGLKYPVRLHVSNTLALSDAHVNQVNAEDLCAHRPDAQGHGQEHDRCRADGRRRRDDHRSQRRQPDQRAPDGQPGRGREQDPHVRPRSTSPTRSCGGRTRWATSRSTSSR